MTVRESVALPENLVRVLSGQARYPGCAALRQSLRPTLEQKHTLEDDDIWTVPDGIEDRLTIVESCRSADCSGCRQNGYALAEILHARKSFSATRANRLLRRSGEFWQREYYDHLVRSEKEFLSDRQLYCRKSETSRIAQLAVRELDLK
jgi:hypothetical protein